LKIFKLPHFLLQ